MWKAEGVCGGVFLVAQVEEWTSMESQVAAEVGTENCWEFEISVPLLDLERDEKTPFRTCNLTRTRLKVPML